MDDMSGQSAVSHEGMDDDLEQPVTYSLLAQKIVESESAVRYDQMMKRKAFEERLTQRFEERWSQAVGQIAELVSKSKRKPRRKKTGTSTSTKGR